MSAFNSVDLDEIEVMDIDGKVSRLSTSPAGDLSQQKVMLMSFCDFKLDYTQPFNNTL